MPRFPKGASTGATTAFPLSIIEFDPPVPIQQAQVALIAAVGGPAPIQLRYHPARKQFCCANCAVDACWSAKVQTSPGEEVLAKGIFARDSGIVCIVEKSRLEAEAAEKARLEAETARLETETVEKSRHEAEAAENARLLEAEKARQAITEDDDDSDDDDDSGDGIWSTKSLDLMKDSPLLAVEMKRTLWGFKQREVEGGGKLKDASYKEVGTRRGGL